MFPIDSHSVVAIPVTDLCSLQAVVAHVCVRATELIIPPPGQGAVRPVDIRQRHSCTQPGLWGEISQGGESAWFPCFCQAGEEEPGVHLEQLWTSPLLESMRAALDY